MEVIKTAVEMTAEEKAQFEAYKAEKAKREAIYQVQEIIDKPIFNHSKQNNNKIKNSTMDARTFFDKVALMRDYQKKYFKTKSSIYHRKSKELEREIDTEIDIVKSILGIYKEAFLNGRKIHTIRSNYDRWNHNIDKIQNGDLLLSLIEWAGKPYNSSQEEITALKSNVSVQKITMKYDSGKKKIYCFVDGKSIPLAIIAKNDGLSVEDFTEWFFGKNPLGDIVFNGAVIQLTDFRY